MEDVIELGADGTFEIPQAAKIPSQKSQWYDDAKNIQYTESPETEFENVIRGLGNNAFKIMKSNNPNVYVIIVKLLESEICLDCLVSNTTIDVVTSNNRTLRINLPQDVNIDPKTATSTSWKELVTIKINQLNK